jgi:hypothetical protein
MAALTLDIDYTEPRSRLTNFFRYVLAIPHLLIVGVLGYAVQLVSVVQWVIILFTGKRNEGIWNFSNGVLNWQTRTATYVGLMYDAYPNFAFEGLNEPVRYGATYEAEASRLTNGLRFIWAIPAIVIMAVLSIAGAVVTLVCWFAILFTAKQPRGMFDFLLKVHRYSMRTNGYVLLLSDTYPVFE